MSDVAVRVEGLGKQYRLGALQGAYRYNSLRESLVKAAHRPWRRLRNAASREASQDLWALKDVSFEVKHGEVLGIIGRNGAGKSTLLKILSRITEPTTGRAEVHGRVGSLLEVGTGFHPELSGRENIFLNGVILGMSRWDVQRRFDEIVAFAELERFLDTPVKRYSSGMYMRLAFSVAAHLETDILLVDEVLAVGDAAFQKKCLGKMGQVAGEGRTVIFVSHQMNAIRRLCDRCLWLDAGRTTALGPTADVVAAYDAATAAAASAAREAGDAAARHTRFLCWEIVEPRAESAHQLAATGPVTMQVTVEVHRPIRHGTHGIALWSEQGLLLWAWATYELQLSSGIWLLRYRLPFLPLRPGSYSWHVSLYEDGELLDVWHATPSLAVVTEPLGHPLDEWAGVLNVPCTFAVEREDGSPLAC